MDKKQASAPHTSTILLGVTTFIFALLWLFNTPKNNNTQIEKLQKQLADCKENAFKDTTNLSMAYKEMGKKLEIVEKRVETLNESEKRIQAQRDSLQGVLTVTISNSKNNNKNTENLLREIAQLRITLKETEDNLAKVRKEKDEAIQFLELANKGLLRENQQLLRDFTDLKTQEKTEITKKVKQLCEDTLKTIQTKRFLKISASKAGRFRDGDLAAGQKGIYINEIIIDYESTKRHEIGKENAKKYPKSFTVAICIIDQWGRLHNPKKNRIPFEVQGAISKTEEFECTAYVEIENKSQRNRIVLDKKDFGGNLGKGSWRVMIFVQDEKYATFWDDNTDDSSKRKIYWEFTV